MLGKLSGCMVLSTLMVSSPAAAQMDWLSPHLEAKRHDNIREHQQRKKKRTQITMAERQAAWSRHKSEYRRKLLSEGQRGADLWLDQQILAGR